jgi:hypothetical protein
MIVNVNPYDTGYDENSHVMKFAALAKEVYTTPAVVPPQRLSSPAKPNIAWKNRSPLKDPEIVPLPFVKRKVTIEVKDKAGRKLSEACLEVIEEDEDVVMGGSEEGRTEEGENDKEGINPLLEALFEQVEELKMKVCLSSVRSSNLHDNWMG